MRISNLSCRYNQVWSLDRISFYIFEGECVGFLGLSFSGKDFLIRLLCGREDFDVRNMHLYIEGKQLMQESERSELIYRLCPGNYTIGEWTAAEYMGLVRRRWLQLRKDRSGMNEKAREQLAQLDIAFDVTRRLSDLTELEKRLMDLAKAVSTGAKLLVIDDEFEGMDIPSIRRFSELLHRGIRKNHMSAIISSHSNLLLNLLSDRFLIFKDGKIVKKCRTDEILEPGQMEAYLLGGSITTRKKSLDAYVREQNEQKNDESVITYRARNLRLNNGKTADFNFVRGKVTVLLVLNEQERERIFLNLSGRRMDEQAYCILDSERLQHGNYLEFVKHRISSVMHMGDGSEVMENMTVTENLLLPSLEKLTFWDYTLFSEAIKTSVEKEESSLLQERQSQAKNLDINDSIQVILQRWYLFHPKVLVLFEPFAQCDLYGISLVKSYIRKFASRGTAVIIVKCREEYIEDIADEIISVN